MKRKLKSDRGFTLAELLIVVAIIGVLVAIAIPIFTSQLERSREAVDLSAVRSAYAEVMMAAITGDTSATYTKDSGQKIYKETDGTYSIMVTPLKQQKDDWQTPLPITIGGVSSSASEPYWVGVPGAGGSCKITYHPPTSTGDEYVSFYWTGGTDNGNSPTSPTPTLPPNSSGNNNSDNSPSIDGIGSLEWPDKESKKTITLHYGQVVSYSDGYYVYADNCNSPKTFLNEWWYFTPDTMNGLFIKITGVKYKSTALDSGGRLSCVNGGDAYIDDDNCVYIAKAFSQNQNVPPATKNDFWVKLISKDVTNWN